ncbi:phosphopantetheine-binding protein [Moritella sp. F3]|uniref:phosphopantetheine-binding protein n=1 Tax=Moritella sp. F3 TaxID=2718882 RepID=UPI0018E1A2D1|nr:phosphopantetheine-binding protein [Moritella sp. F3]GIC76881.1 acyl carrier protein [Moritella sp. F1]GIC81067.1 acyl carrier protein [Moritella sp. F3]
MTELKTELKQLIIAELDLEDIAVEDINDADALFVEGLGLDSIDALELGLILKKHYDIKIDANSEEIKQHFSSINALSAFITQTRITA